MSQIKGGSANEIQWGLCRLVMGQGSLVDPRKMPTKEVLGVSFELKQPRNRLTTLPIRQWSSALAVGELAWHLRGDKDVEPLAFYTPRWRDFADNAGEVRGSCYGARIFGRTEDQPTSQWDNVKELLSKDPNSRRAVLSFQSGANVAAVTNDLSCTNTLQFLSREGKLHAFVSMRSNDVIWGVPYDLFLFTSLQELMAIELGQELGSYHHYASSMHIYDRHYLLAEKISELSGERFESGHMPPMTDSSFVRRLPQDEATLRNGERVRGDRTDYELANLNLLLQHKKIKLAA